MPVKKKLILMGVAAALVTTTIIGGTLAATPYRDSTGEETADITTKSLSLSLDGNEKTITAYDSHLIAEGMIPGQSISVNRIITNDGDYAFFARVTLYKNWGATQEVPVSGDAVVYAAEKVKLMGDPLLGNQVSIVPGNGWTVFYEDDEQMVLYYMSAVQPGGETTSFLNEIGLSTDSGNEYANQLINMDINVQAVQADAGEDAIAAVWGVFPTISGNVITDIREE